MQIHEPIPSIPPPTVGLEDPALTDSAAEFTASYRARSGLGTTAITPDVEASNAEFGYIPPATPDQYQPHPKPTAAARRFGLTG